VVASPATLPHPRPTNVCELKYGQLWDLVFSEKIEARSMHLPKLGIRSDEAMKRCDEALNASSLQVFASVKRFIALLL
jgi:hypothetical protein